eukprot:14113699-Alexandrium_andersonii.AAC.1
MCIRDSRHAAAVPRDHGVQRCREANASREGDGGHKLVVGHHAGRNVVGRREHVHWSRRTRHAA